MTSESGSRTLAPAPPTSPFELQSPTDNHASKKKASLACSACRKRKSRCTDGTPCQACKAHGTDCIKDETEDMRRRVAVKKRLESVESNRKLLDSILEALRIGTHEQVLSLVNLVRSNAPREDIQAFLDDRFNDPNSMILTGIESLEADAQLLHSNHERRQRRHTGNIADLINPPIQVPAKPWTTVTTDDDFVSHLISLWFAWAHQWWHWVDKESFLEAMRSQDLNNPLCAPYLVNMILADACLLDSLDDAEEEPHPILRDQFYMEARKGLEAEQGRISLTLVQTTGVQWTYLDMNGQDKLGLLVLNEQVFTAKELDKYHTRLSKDPHISPETLFKVDRAINRLEWALFALDSFTLIGSQRTLLMSPPKRPHPAYDHDNEEQSETWTPYPRRAPRLDFHQACHFACLTSVAGAAREMELAFARPVNQQLGVSELFSLKQKLEQWPSTLPPCMRLHDKAMPHVLALHAIHHWVVLCLTRQAAASAAGQIDKPTITSTPSSWTSPYWKKASVSTSVAIGHLMDLLISRWGVEHFPVILIHPLAVALPIMLDDMAHEDGKQAFVNMCIALRAASRRFKVGRGILQLVAKVAMKKGVTLPPESEELFRFERRANSESTGTGSPGEWEEAPVEDIGVHYLLEKWHDLNLDDE